MKRIRHYFAKYNEYDANAWNWSVIDEHNNFELYRKYRIRFDADDIVPSFTEIEKDAVRLGLTSCEITDCVGVRWRGKRGCWKTVGSPDAMGSLYSYEADEEDGFEWYIPSDIYALADRKFYEKAENDGYIVFHSPIHGIEMIDVKDIADIEYSYHVTNHLFKDTHMKVIYKDGDELLIWDSAYDALVKYIEEHRDVYGPMLDNLYSKIDEHFNALKNSEYEHIRDWYPNRTAKEYFSLR